MTNAIIWGGTSQARVLRPILEANGHRLVAVFDDRADVPPAFPDLPTRRGDSFDAFVADLSDPLGFMVAIGGSKGEARLRVHQRLCERGLRPLTLVHPRAWVADDAALGDGAQILAMAAIGVGVRLGRAVIVNTSASVDHDCNLMDGVHVMPGAVLSGGVTVGACASIGSGSTILPNLNIGDGAFVGAGAVVTRDVPAHAVVLGIPARVRPTGAE